MAPGTNAGAAHPVTLFGKPDETMMKKIENDAAALMRSVAAKRGRNVELAESAVRESKSFTEQEALDKKLIDYVAPSEQDLFRQMSGKSFKRFDGATVTLNLTGQPVRNYQMTLKERILSYIMDPNITLIILLIGALCLYVEFNHPGAVVPGTIGVIFIVLAAFALHLLPDPLRGARDDSGCLRPVRRRSQVRQSRRPDHGRNCASDSGRLAAGRRAHPRNARPPR